MSTFEHPNKTSRAFASWRLCGIGLSAFQDLCAPHPSKLFPIRRKNLHRPTQNSHFSSFLRINPLKHQLPMRKSMIYASMISALAISLTIISCQEEPEPEAGVMPERFSVEIPSSITTSAAAGRTQADTLSGNAVYLNLATFIAVGGGSAKIVEEIIHGINRYALVNVETATFNGDDDGRTKHLVVTKEVAFEGKTWEYMLLVTDADSEGNADGGKALQVYWNHGTPIHGVAMIKPYNIDRAHNGNVPNAMYRVDYDEQTDDYDAQMEISISGLPTPAGELFSISTLHMFVGKKGDVVDVLGNSNHPNASFFTQTKGFNWAFVAAGSDNQNIAVAEVGLPPSSLNESNRTLLLKEYSIENVFTAEVQAAFPLLPEIYIKSYLKNTAAPGYFSNQGFVAGGKSPGTAWDALNTRLNDLTPYNPKATADLIVRFGE
jgi:hypothetical protein